MHFKTKTDVAQNFFLLTLTVRGFSIGRILSEEKYEGTGLIFEKTSFFCRTLHENGSRHQ